MNTSTEKTILVKGIAGLGNRVLALLSATLYAELTGRKIYVDWSDGVFGPKDSNSTGFSNLFPLLFSSPNITPWSNETKFTSITPPLWETHLDLSAANFTKNYGAIPPQKFNAYKATSAEISNLNYSEDMVVLWSYRERILPMRTGLKKRYPHLAKMSDYQLLKELAQKSLAPSQEVQNNIDAFFSTIPHKDPIGIHVRHTDIKTPVNKILKKARKTIRKNNSNCIVLCTDNAKIEQQVKNNFSDCDVYSTTKQFSQSDSPLHYDLDCSNRELRAIEALTDMYILAQCKSLIYCGRSSFGYVASILAENDINVINIDKYNLKDRIKKAVQKYYYQ